MTSLVPRAHLLMRKRVWWPLSDFLLVPSQQSAISHVTWVAQQKRGWGLGTRLWIRRLVDRAHGCMTWRYFIGLFSIKTADSAQPRNCSMVTRPFSLWEGGVWAWDYSVTWHHIYHDTVTIVEHPKWVICVYSVRWSTDLTSRVVRPRPLLILIPPLAYINSR